MLKDIDFLQEIFDRCLELDKTNQPITKDSVISVFTMPTDDEGQYWLLRNILSSLNILEKLKLIHGTPTVSFTRLRLALPSRTGTVSFLGKILGYFPSFISKILFGIYLIRHAFLSVLTALSFMLLIQRASLGFDLLSDKLSYLAAAVITFTVFVILRKILS